LVIPSNAKVLEIGCGDGSLLKELPNQDITGIDVSADQVALATKNIPHGRFILGAGEIISLPETFDVIIISDTLNLAADVQAMLKQALRMAHPKTRLVVNFHSTLWRPIRSLAEALGLVGSSPPSSWLSAGDVQNLMTLAGWDMISQNARILLPARIPVACATSSVALHDGFSSSASWTNSNTVKPAISLCSYSSTKRSWQYCCGHSKNATNGLLDRVHICGRAFQR
jgi:SAM-dependent methyltransferase